MLFPGTPHQHRHSMPPALESSQSGSSHSLRPAVGPLHPTSFQGLSALITCCRPGTSLVQRSMTAHSDLPLEQEGDGAVSSGRATTPYSQDLFASPLATFSSTAGNDDDPIVDSAGMFLEIVQNRACHVLYTVHACMAARALPCLIAFRMYMHVA